MAGNSYSTWGSPINPHSGAVDVFAVRISDPTPGKTKLIFPSGGIITTKPTYVWNAVPTATKYVLYVRDVTGAVNVNQSLTAVETGCPLGWGTCSTTPSTTLELSAYTWWIRASTDATDGPWSDPLTFSVTRYGPPGAATLISPSGTIPTRNPPYTWNAVHSATWYYLRVNDCTGTKIANWYTAGQVGCSSGIGPCSMTPSATLASGAAQWWIQTWNDYGYGPLSTGMSFIVP